MSEGKDVSEAAKMEGKEVPETESRSEIESAVEGVEKDSGEKYEGTTEEEEEGEGSKEGEGETEQEEEDDEPLFKKDGRNPMTVRALDEYESLAQIADMSVAMMEMERERASAGYAGLGMEEILKIQWDEETKKRKEEVSLLTTLLKAMRDQLR